MTIQKGYVLVGFSNNTRVYSIAPKIHDKYTTKNLILLIIKYCYKLNNTANIILNILGINTYEVLYWTTTMTLRIVHGARLFNVAVFFKFI